MNKKLYLAFENNNQHQDYPFAYILSDDLDAAKIKALDVLQSIWDKGKIGHEKFYRETLGYGHKKRIPDYEKETRAGPRPNKIEDVNLLEPFENEFYVL